MTFDISSRDLVGTVLLADGDAAALPVMMGTLVQAGFAVTGACSTQAVLDAFERAHFDLFVLDTDTGGDQCLGLLCNVARRALPTILLSTRPTIDTMMQALRLSVVDCLVKPFAPIELVERCRVAIPKPPLARQERAGSESSQEYLYGLASGRLTGREREVLRRLARGNSVGQIQDALGISANTVRTHLKSIYRKVGVRNQVELMSKLLGHLSSRALTL